MKKFFAEIVIFISFIIVNCSGQNDYQKRNRISLNGIWKVAESIDITIPEVFPAKIVVPGLMDLAEPKFDSLGVESNLRRYFWYKKKVNITSDKPLAFLKIHKAKFGQRVYVNGRYAGEYNYCFTPGLFEVSDLIVRNTENEIVIRIGASPAALPDTIPYGEDAEKSLYYPGIYDEIEMYFADYPLIKHIQIIPKVSSGN